MSRSRSLALGISLITLTGGAFAGVVTVSPLAGYHIYDEDVRPDLAAPAKELDNAAQYGLGLGYRFTPAWSVEASVGRVRTHEESPFNTVKARTLSESLDAMYRFNPDARLNPYVLLGAGRNLYKADNAASSFAHGYAETGGGLMYALNDNINLRAEARYQHEPGDSWNNWIALAGVEIGLGHFDKAAPAPMPVAAQPEPAPAPVAAPQPAPAPVVLDDDKDGVPNDKDQCPGTAAGIAVDANGCALDGDKDGVPDSLDKCPDTKAGAAVDASGCYVVLKDSETINLNVNFATGKTEILGDATAELTKVADFMKKFPNVDVTIEGHTDNRGKADKNQTLSQKRAEAVREALVKLGVDGTRLKAVGYGATKPVADNKTEEGRAKNRRVVATAKGESESIKMKK